MLGENSQGSETLMTPFGASVFAIVSSAAYVQRAPAHEREALRRAVREGCFEARLKVSLVDANKKTFRGAGTIPSLVAAWASDVWANVVERSMDALPEDELLQVFDHSNESNTRANRSYEESKADNQSSLRK